MIKWIVKWIFRLVFLVVILVVVLILSLDSIVRSALEQRIRRETGMDTRIGRVSVGILSPELSAENIKVYNSAEYGGTLFLDIPEVHVEYDRLALLRRRLHLTLLRFNLAEANVVKGDKGRTNVLSMEAVTRKKGGASTRFDFAGIDVLNLSVGKIRFTDLKNPKQNHERVFGIKDRVYRNVKTVGDLEAIVLLLWLQSTGNPLHTSHSSPTNHLINARSAGLERDLQVASTNCCHRPVRFVEFGRYLTTVHEAA